MTSEQLNTIRSRVQAATEGPWFVGTWSGQCHMDHFHGRGHCKYEYKKSDYSEGCCVSVDTEKHIELIGYNDYGPVLSSKNAEFIAHARQDIPALLDYIDELVNRPNRKIT